MVVDGSPVIDDRLGLEHGVERLDREDFVADAGAERLDELVLPGGARLDEAAAAAAEPAPVADGVRGHLGAVVHPHELRCGAALTDDLVEHPHRVVGVDRAGNTDRQGLAGVLIDHVEQLQRAAVDGRVELEVQRPDVIRALRPQPLRGHSRVAKAKPFPFALRHAQALLAPQPLNLLAVHRPALVADSAPGQPVTPTRVLRGELPQPRAERVVALASATMIVALG